MDSKLKGATHRNHKQRVKRYPEALECNEDVKELLKYYQVTKAIKGFENVRWGSLGTDDASNDAITSPITTNKLN